MKPFMREWLTTMDIVTESCMILDTMDTLISIDMHIWSPDHLKRRLVDVKEIWRIKSSLTKDTSGK